MKIAFLVSLSQGEPGSHPDRVFLSRELAEAYAAEKNNSPDNPFFYIVDAVYIADEQHTTALEELERRIKNALEYIEESGDDPARNIKAILKGELVWPNKAARAAGEK